MVPMVTYMLMKLGFLGSSQGFQADHQAPLPHRNIFVVSTDWNTLILTLWRSNHQHLWQLSPSTCEDNNNKKVFQKIYHKLQERKSGIHKTCVIWFSFFFFLLRTSNTALWLQAHMSFLKVRVTRNKEGPSHARARQGMKHLHSSRGECGCSKRSIGMVRVPSWHENHWFWSGLGSRFQEPGVTGSMLYDLVIVSIESSRLKTNKTQQKTPHTHTHTTQGRLVI